MEDAKKPELLVVTGMSGAGRSTVGNALEDQGWYVIDNLPPQMLGPISDLFALSKSKLPKIAVITDVRGGEFFNELQTKLAELKVRDIVVRVLFLEASDSALVKRFESVRRPHPLQTPACFWITNPNNNFIENRCGGSDRYGYWYDL